MRKQICLQFKDAMEEINQSECNNFQASNIKTDNCYVGLELNFQSDKKGTN